MDLRCFSGDVMVSTGITCAADKEARTLTMTFPEGAFDERRAWAMFAQALGMFLGRKHSVAAIERWVDLEEMMIPDVRGG